MTEQKTKSKDRITVSDLKHYVPIFQEADRAMERLLESDLEIHEKNRLETVARMRSISIARIADLCAPLITSEVSNIVKSSRISISNDPTIFDVVYQAGIGGMIRGLRKYNIEKINISSTNYLMQWVTTYAKKEMLSIETPEGIAPSRYQKLKKIAAVRSKISSEKGREATNQEVLEFFHSGNADIENKNGRVGSSEVPYASNKKIDLSIIEEQEALYRGDIGATSIDTQENVQESMSQRDDEILSESIFGRFLSSYDVFSDRAGAVLLSEMNVSRMGQTAENIVSTMSSTEYRSLSTMWKKYLREPDSLFFEFLKDIDRDPESEFDVSALIARIEDQPEQRKSNYSKLFKRSIK